ncbi:TIGR02449 family protein [Agarilytica rhodophyticola]|uniref:TIGR02449 family protein n=1 Tax=Agarilytica rhodophyticola TaxID=1737490 RepID=UPI000B3418CF|nr:TIGR02449 family protein [Agarilytica rhodophyticola]
MATSLIKNVEGKLDELIRICSRLEKENSTLRAKEEGWQQERKRLMEKNEIARARVEAMIQHLKTLETES